MMYVDFNVNNKTYKLRLNTRSIVLLEERLGYNPLHVFGDGTYTPKVTNMVDVLYASLQQHHEMSLDDTFELFDAWLAEGNTPPEFLPIIIKIYKLSGLIKNTEKN